MCTHRTNPFRDVVHNEEGEHPVDVAAGEHPKTRSVARLVKYATERLEAELEDRSLWIDLEALINEYRQCREEFFFNTGYQHGFVAERSKAG